MAGSAAGSSPDGSSRSEARPQTPPLRSDASPNASPPSGNAVHLERPPKSVNVFVAVIVVVAEPVIVAVHVHGNATVRVIENVKDR